MAANGSLPSYKSTLEMQKKNLFSYCSDNVVNESQALNSSGLWSVTDVYVTRSVGLLLYVIPQRIVFFLSRNENKNMKKVSHRTPKK